MASFVKDFQYFNINLNPFFKRIQKVASWKKSLMELLFLLGVSQAVKNKTLSKQTRKLITSIEKNFKDCSTQRIMIEISNSIVGFTIFSCQESISNISNSIRVSAFASLPLHPIPDYHCSRFHS